MNTEEKKKLSEQFNISLPTFYSWEKNKPRLIELIILGLQKEKELSENAEVAGELYPIVMELKKELEELKSEIKK